MSLYRRGGRWWFDLTIRTAEGRIKRIRKSTGQRDRNVAKLVYTKELGRLEDLAARKDPTLRELFNDFETHSRVNIGRGTWARYRASLGHFMDFVASSGWPADTFRVSRIDARMVEEYKAARVKQGARPVTLNIELRALRRCFNVGIYLGILPSNPFKGIELPRCEKNLPKFLDRDQVARLLDAARWIDENPRPCTPVAVPLYPVVTILLNTGLRRGELLNLLWADVDLDKGKLYVRNRDEWKSKTLSERVVDLNIDARRALRSLKPKDKEGKEVDPAPDAVVAPIEERNFSRRVERAYLKAGLTREIKRKDGRVELRAAYDVHTFRHTFASHLVMGGAPLPTVKELLGHSSIMTTMIYAHLSDAHLRKAVNTLDFGTKDPKVARIDEAAQG